MPLSNPPQEAMGTSDVLPDRRCDESADIGEISLVPMQQLGVAVLLPRLLRDAGDDAIST
jgi:hypothetical protein